MFPFMGRGRAASWGPISDMMSELFCIGKLLMASSAFTNFCFRWCASLVDLDSNGFAIKLARRLDVGPFFVWVAVGSFRVFGFVV